jgi:hypothetical protein
VDVTGTEFIGYGDSCHNNLQTKTPINQIPSAKLKPEALAKLQGENREGR